jgi:group I intron endonuclease
MKGGVYIIENSVNNKVYIGYSLDPYKRWEDHQKDLNEHKHHCIALQRAWVKYGKNVFVFRIVEWTNGNHKELEQKLINSYFKKWNECYNVSRSAYGGGNTPSYPILQIKNGEILGYYESANDCDRKSNGYFNQGRIHSALVKKEVKSSYGYEWEYAELFPNVKEREEYLNGYRNHFIKHKSIKGKCKPIIIKNIKTGEETYFESIAKVKELLNIDLRPITRGVKTEVKGYTCKIA